MSARPASVLACAACGAAPPADDPYPFRCPNADSGDGADHLLARRLDLAQLTFPPASAGVQPFVRYRTLLHAWHRAQAGGLDDAAYLKLVHKYQRELMVRTERGLYETPFAHAPGLAAHVGLSPGTALRVKDETGNPGGSHKTRHLFGLLLHLAVSEALGLTTLAETKRRGLAIASCGNAALAASIVGRMDDRPLTAFIPTDASPRVVAQLGERGVRVEVCERGAEAGAGDPCVLAFRHALAEGALPFCCQGNENGLTIEGGMTLAWEMVTALAGTAPERLYVQVGGGALASACAQGLAEAHALGALDRLPRFHAVQTRSATPLARAYERVRARVLARLGLAPAPTPSTAADDAALAERIRADAASPEVQGELAYARAHRAEFMWPWESTPYSVAHGILDDETYDWHAIVVGMIESGGFPVTVGEARLAEARAVAQATTDCMVDATGAAGLAGLIELRGLGVHAPDESAAVLFTGGERG